MEFNLLIKLIDKNEAQSIIKKEEVEILRGKIADVFRDITNETKKPNHGKSVFRVSNFVEQVIKDMPKNLDTNNVAEIIGNQDKYVPAILLEFVGKNREKRQSNGAETATGMEMKEIMSEEQTGNGEEMSKQYAGISVYDIVNKTPRQIENLSQWLLARNSDKNSQSKPRLFAALDNDVNGSEINIHITGVPQPIKLYPEDFEMVGKDDKIDRMDSMSAESFKKFDDFGMLVSGASTDVPAIMNIEIKSLGNPAKSEMSKNHGNYGRDEIDITHYRPLDMNDNTQFSNATNYEFTFPENPISIENEYNHDVDITVKETADEFKAQLDRIETRAIIIENAVFDIITKINNNERYQSTDDPILGIVDQENKDPFVYEAALRQRAKSFPLPNDSPTGESFFLSNTPKSRESADAPVAKELNSIPSNRRWRMIRRNSSEASKHSEVRKRRPDRNERKGIEPKVNLVRSHESRNGPRSNRRRQKSSRRPGPTKLMQRSTEALGDRKFPILLDNDGPRSANVHYYQDEDPRLFSSDQSGLESSASSPAEQSVWPFDRMVNRALPADRSNRKIEERIRVSGRNLRPVDSMLEESITLLETQIPRSTKSRDSTVALDHMGQSSLRFLTKYGKSLSEDSAEGQSAFNLFVVDAEHSDAASKGSRVPETLVLPMVSFDTKINQQGDQELDVSYSLFPAYLDYAEKTEIMDEEDESVVVSTPSSASPVRNQSTNPAAVRSKRNVENDFFTINHSNDTKVDHLVAEASDTRIRDLEGQKSSLKKRAKRGVQMVDWLRAAQEYHERLRQVRTAAIKTWLASREIASDANLTNVKLFSREVPPYLEQYKPIDFQENFDDFSGARGQDYPTESDDSVEWNGDASDILTDVYVDDSMPRDNDSQPEMSENDEVRFIEVSSSSGPRKFTIITNGNSTIRIEGTVNNDNSTKFEDQLAEGSTNRETAHENLDFLSDLDYFDHMYESFDTDDGDFNYEDSYSPEFGWMSEFDVIENADAEVSEEPEKSNVKSDEVQQEDSSARFKRESPFVLFKVQGNAEKDIVIWPSRWMDLMHRHLRLNHTGNTPQRMTKRRSYLRPRKTDLKLIPSRFETIAASEPEIEH